MLIKAEIDERYIETELHVCNHERTEEVKQLLTELHNYYDTSLIGTDERGNKVKLSPRELVSFYSEGQKVLALGGKEKYTVSKKLYELEKELESIGFIRISKSELVNIKRIKSMDLSLTGTIRIIMNTGYETYTSRRNVAKIKEMTRI
ncbi:MAG: LytTR family transcriptional regulator [Lachnospiraceae bacterium]|nr:LytTR family transcriptional regulator [Lachnospiraceae bacterium]